MFTFKETDILATQAEGALGLLGPSNPETLAVLPQVSLTPTHHPSADS